MLIFLVYHTFVAVKLDPGIYKIREKAWLEDNALYLFVFVTNKRKYWKLPGRAPVECDRYGNVELEEVVFGKKLTRPFKIKRVRFTVEWWDDEGDHFTHKGTNVHVIRNLFREIEELKDAAGINDKSALKKKK